MAVDPSFVAINIAYLFYLGATIPKRIVPLRLTLIVASVAFVIYGLIADNRSVIVWNLLFGIPQLYQLLRQLRLQARVELTAEEEAMRAARFSSMTPRDFLVFWSLGEERNADDRQLITQNERAEDLVMVVTGNASVSIDGQHVANRGPGNILGEAGFITGEPASATVVLSEDAVVRLWRHDKLDALNRAQPDVASALLSTFAKELSLKMKTQSS